MTLIDGQVLHILEPTGHALIGLADDAILSGLDPPHVDGDAAIDDNTEVGPATCHIRRPGTCDEGLGRDAPDVDTGPAKQFAFDNSHLHADAGQPSSERRTGLAGPDDDGVEFLIHEVVPLAKVALRCKSLATVR